MIKDTLFLRQWLHIIPACSEGFFILLGNIIVLVMAKGEK